MRTFAQKQRQPRKLMLSRPRRKVASVGTYSHKHPILRLQRLIGNQAVLRILHTASPRMIFRQTVEQYETRGIPITQDTLRNVARYGFWGEKLEAAGFPIAGIDPLLFDNEQQNAALAVVFQTLPTTRITQETTRLITIPPRPGGKTFPLTCEMIFSPPVTAAQKGTVQIRLVASGPGASTANLDAPSTSFTTSQANQHEYTPKTRSYSERDFPLGGSARYWEAHHEEFLRLFYWVEKTAGASFDQVLTIPLGNKSSSSFHVTGKKDRSGEVTGLTIVFLGATAPTTQQAPRDYASHDFLEILQTTEDPTRRDKLGRVNGLTGLKPEERHSVEVAIWEYFKSDPSKQKVGTRNAEVDAIVPIIDPPVSMAPHAIRNRRMLVTLLFKPNTNDVDVQKVGELGVGGVSLEPQGNLARINGFLDHTQGATEADKVTALTGWLKTRYPKVPLPTITAGTTVAEIEKDITAKIQNGSSNPKWYEDNYGIKILTPGDATLRLRKLGLTKTEDLQDLQSFTSAELPLLELALEKMSDTVVASFKGVQFIRQKVYFEWKVGATPGSGRTGCTSAGCFEKKDEVAGVTRGGKSKPTITIFDQAWANINTLFLGGTVSGDKPDVELAPTEVFAHELGHVVSYDLALKAKFDKLVHDKGIRPITWYAASDPPKELFAESFALYYSAPKWLQENWPDLFDFFDAFDKASPAKTGSGRKP